MNCVAKYLEDANELSVQGFVDTAASLVFEVEIDKVLDVNKDLILDFQEVEYISSSCLRVLLKTSKFLAKNRHSLNIKNVTAPVREVFILTGFSAIIGLE